MLVGLKLPKFDWKCRMRSFKWLKKIPNWTGNQKHLGEKTADLNKAFRRPSPKAFLWSSDPPLSKERLNLWETFWISSFTLLNRQHVRVDPKTNVTSTLSSSFTSVFKSEIGNLIWKKNLNQFIGQLQTSNTLFIFFFKSLYSVVKKRKPLLLLLLFSIYLKHFEGAFRKNNIIQLREMMALEIRNKIKNKNSP